MRSQHCLMLIFLALFSTVGLAGSAQSQSVVRLGEARVSLASGRATISLSGGARIDRIQLESLDHAVQVISATVMFADGRVQRLGGMTLAANSRSGEMGLGAAAAPKRLSLVFRPQIGEQTRIVVYGRIVEVRPTGPATSESSGSRRKAYRMSKGGRPVESAPADEGDGSSEPRAAENQERQRQEEARRQAEERARQEQYSRQQEAQQQAARSRSATAPPPVKRRRHPLRRPGLRTHPPSAVRLPAR